MYTPAAVLVASTKRLQQRRSCLPVADNLGRVLGFNVPVVSQQRHVGVPRQEGRRGWRYSHPTYHDSDQANTTERALMHTTPSLPWEGYKEEYFLIVDDVDLHYKMNGHVPSPRSIKCRDLGINQGDCSRKVSIGKVQS